jgi:hypothetical protein
VDPDVSGGLTAAVQDDGISGSDLGWVCVVGLMKTIHTAAPLVAVLASHWSVSGVPLPCVAL